MFGVSMTKAAEAELQATTDDRRARRGREGSDGADALLDNLLAAMDTLTRFPRRGAMPGELAARGIKDGRQPVCPPTRIITTAHGQEVVVVVVADARQDFSSLLEQRLLRAPPPP